MQVERGKGQEVSSALRHPFCFLLPIFNPDQHPLAIVGSACVAGQGFFALPIFSNINSLLCRDREADASTQVQKPLFAWSRGANGSPAPRSPGTGVSWAS